jgi:GTPase
LPELPRQPNPLQLINRVLERSKNTDQEVERAVVAVLLLPGLGASQANQPTTEIRGLAQAAGAKVVAEVVQRKDKPTVRTAFGKGKVEEIKLLCEQCDAQLLVVDFDLSPSQARNLEKEIQVRVVDRTELILDIFATRARTRQAKLQVELAQLQYMKSRLRRMWTHLERTGAMIGTRGPGETQLESDRRMIADKITELKRRLSGIEGRSERRAINRLDPNTISLIGYTNAGKSSLLVHLTGADAYVADQLFATLDTLVRYWRLHDRRTVMLADTVGFVRDLPHHLVASFHATLEETLHADLLLHVLDASDPDLPLNFEAVNDVLGSLDTDQTPSLLVLNKADLLDATERIAIQSQFPEAILVSVLTGEGIDRLDAAVASILDSWSLHLELIVPSSEGRLLAQIHRVCRLEHEEYRAGNWCGRVWIGARHWALLQGPIRNAGAEFRALNSVH